MHTNTGGTIPDDEIDLSRIQNRLVSFSARTIYLVRRYFFVFVAVTVAGIILAFALKSLLTKRYTSTFIVKPTDRQDKFHLKILGDIQMLLAHQDTKGLARELKMDENQVSQILGLDTRNPFVQNRSDSINYTEVTMHVADPSILLPTQAALMNYLEVNPYFAKIKVLNKKNNDANLAQVHRDLEMLDSLKRLQLIHYNKQTVPGGSQLLLADLINPTATYTMGAERLQRRNLLLAQQLFLDNFQLVKSCIPVKQHSWPPRLLVLSLYIVLPLLLLTLIILWFRKPA